MEELHQIIGILKKYHNDKEQLNNELKPYIKKYPSLRDILEQLSVKEFLANEIRVFDLLSRNCSVEVTEFNWKKIQARIDSKSIHIAENRRRVKWFKYVAAASILIAGLLSYLFLYNPVSDRIENEKYTHFKPGENKAILTLPNGDRVELSSMETGISFENDIEYRDGTSVVNSPEKIDDIQMLTVTVPRGGKYEVTLADGTKVWLNSDTKLTYPRRFSGDTRTVSMEGEAYFEVVHNTSKPFVVKTNTESVKVLGTEFNVNAYPDEPISYITLLEGKVDVSNAHSSPRVLAPGEQAICTNQSLAVKPVNTDEVTAWKNGEFLFNNTKLSEVMLTLSRWYDFEYELDPDLKNVQIWGAISRKTTLNETLKLIKLTDKDMQIQAKGRRITISK